MKSYEKIARSCTRTALFKEIQTEELAALLSCLQPRITLYQRGDIIVSSGESLESIGMVLSGEASVIKENAAGNRMMMLKLKPGDLFGETVAFAGGPSWVATAQAETICEIMFIPKEKIVEPCARMCSWHRTLIRNMLSIIAKRALILNKKVEYLAIKTMRGKISNYLLEEYAKNKTAVFTLPLKRKELAEFLNVSRPSMSREMSKMRSEGIIDFHLSKVTIKDLDRLKSMLE